eukprot:jgi/Botrbrau1/16040/Bobra.7_2s0014.1
MDAMASIMKSGSMSPPTQSCSTGKRRFLSSLLELKAGASQEQRDHARVQREILLRDLEEQVRLKREEKQARLAAERAAEEKEEAKLREYYAKKAASTHVEVEHASSQSPGDAQDAQHNLPDLCARVTFTVPTDVERVHRYKQGEPAGTSCTSAALESPSTPPLPMPGGTFRADCGPSRSSARVYDPPVMVRSVRKTPDAVGVSADRGPLSEIDKGLSQAPLFANCTRSLQIAIPGGTATSALEAENRVDQLFQQLRAEQAALKQQCANQAMLLENMRSTQASRERHSRSPVATDYLLHGAEELPSSSDLVALQLNHIPESADDIPFYSGPLQDSLSATLPNDENQVPGAASQKAQDGPRSCCEEVDLKRLAKKPKQHKKNPMASSNVQPQIITPSGAINSKRDQRARDSNLRVPLVRRAWAR